MNNLETKSVQTLLSSHTPETSEGSTSTFPNHESHSQIQTFTTSPSVARLWRPAAQRNLRNQWSKLGSLRHDWQAASADGRSHATSLVNSYLSQKYMDGTDFGVLSNMPNIRTKASQKLLKQQQLYKQKLLSSYRDMVAIVIRMVDASKTMRCYFKGTTTSSSPLAQFSLSHEDGCDTGDCGGAAVFTFWSVCSFEELACEVVWMFVSELNLKRLLVLEFLSIYDEKVAEIVKLSWCDEFYEGEFDDLRKCGLYSGESCEPVVPSVSGGLSSGGGLTTREYKKHEYDSNVLQVYITTWMVEVNIDRCRVDEILAVVGAEMHVELS